MVACDCACRTVYFSYSNIFPMICLWFNNNYLSCFVYQFLTLRLSNITVTKYSAVAEWLFTRVWHGNVYRNFFKQFCRNVVSWSCWVSVEHLILYSCFFSYTFSIRAHQSGVRCIYAGRVWKCIQKLCRIVLSG